MPSSLRAQIYRAAFLLALALFALMGRSAAAPAPSDQPLGDLHHTRWTQKDGVPGLVLSLAQTSDGYLWVGTGSGLYRFDGLRFERFESIAGQSLPSRGVFSLHAVKDRGLWVGLLDGGAALIRDGKVEVLDAKIGQFGGGSTRSFVTDRDGVLWVVTSTGLYRREGTQWVHVGKESGLGDWAPGKRILREIRMDGDGNLWVPVQDALYVKRRHSAHFEATSFPGYYAFSRLVVAADGRVWASGADDKRVLVGNDLQGRLYRLPRPGHEEDRTDDWRHTTVAFAAPLVDSRGTFWYGGAHGLVRDRPDAATVQERQGLLQNMTADQGLSGDRVLSTFEDREGSIWVGTSGGLDRFRASAVGNVRFESAPAEIAMAAAPDGTMWFYSHQQPMRLLRPGSDILEPTGLKRPCGIHRMMFDSQAKLWIGCGEGFGRQEGDQLVELPIPGDASWKGWPPGGLRQGPDGAVWVFVRSRGVLRFKNDQWDSGDGHWPGPPARMPTALVLDSQGRPVVGYADGGVAILTDQGATLIGTADGLRVGQVRAISVQGPRIWIAGDTGVQLISAPGRPFLQTQDPTATELITGLIETPDGDLWLNGSSGITRIQAKDIQRALAKPEEPVSFTRIDSLDGLQGRARQGYGVDSVVRSPDGELWFSLNNGVARIDPKRELQTPIRLSVDIQRIVTGRQSLAMSGQTKSQIAAGTRDLEIQYTAPGARIPERVRFRYRLDGQDRDWQNAGSRRQAFYTNLGPGTYTFRVEASVDGSRWEDAASSVTIELPPTLTQTWWFRTGCVLLAVAMLVVGIWLRLRSLATRQREQLLVRMRERERVAQDLHDTLLQGVMSLILRLQGEARQVPERHRPQLQRIVDDADAVWHEARDRVKDLRRQDLDGVSMERVLTDFAEQLVLGQDIAFSLRVDGTPRPLQAHCRDELTLMAREAIFNAFQHARASRIVVLVDHGRHALRIEVSDDGVGIPEDVRAQGGRPGHWGLHGMRERAKRLGASLEIESSAPQGSRIVLVLAARLAYDATPSRLTLRQVLQRLAVLD